MEKPLIIPNSYTYKQKSDFAYIAINGWICVYV